MAIMKCPKCGGSGEVWQGYGDNTTIALTKSPCPSCGGKGYVIDKD